MTYHGRVKNNVIILDPGASLPDGTEVGVQTLKRRSGRKTTKNGSVARKSNAKIPTLYERMKAFIGKAKGLPPDLAENHDHYLYGRPKK